MADGHYDVAKGARIRVKTIRIATWNLNTWINRSKKKIFNGQLWHWADQQLAADLVIFTEAETPPPSQSVKGWSVAHRPGGFPGVSRWGTIIAGKGLRVERIAHVGDYQLDMHYPGSLTAADVWVGDTFVATVIGLYLPFRKDKRKVFIGNPFEDLSTVGGDIVQLFEHRRGLFIVAGDLNHEHHCIPPALSKLGAAGTRLVDPFAGVLPKTFEQDWANRRQYTLDYLYVSETLADRIVHKKGGIADFPTAFSMSDHAPLLVEIRI